MSVLHRAAFWVITLATFTASVSGEAQGFKPGRVDPTTLAEVRWLSELPQALRATLGRNKSGLEGFAELREPFNSTDVVDSRLPLRRFLVAGLSAKAAIVAYEQGGPDYGAHPYHASAYVLENSAWRRTGDWTLIRRPYTLGDVTSLVGMSQARSGGIADRIGSRPARRDGPLRETNISDDEVREIQAAAHGVVPDSLVNISGVVTGCACEDGAGCTDQVWIVAYSPGLMKGLQLSRINKRWTIGPVQQWWLELENIDEHRDRYASWGDFLTAREALYEKFPACTGGASADATLPVKSPQPGTKPATP